MNLSKLIGPPEQVEFMDIEQLRKTHAGMVAMRQSALATKDVEKLKKAYFYDIQIIGQMAEIEPENNSYARWLCPFWNGTKYIDNSLIDWRKKMTFDEKFALKEWAKS